MESVIQNLSYYMDENHLITDLKDILYFLYWKYQEQKKYRLNNEKNDLQFLEYLGTLAKADKHGHKFINCHPLELDCRERILKQIRKLFDCLPPTESCFSYGEYEQLIRLISPKLNTAEFISWIQLCEGGRASGESQTSTISSATATATNASNFQTSETIAKDRFLGYFSVIFLYSDFLKQFSQSLNLKQSDAHVMRSEEGMICFLQSLEQACEKELGRGQYPPFHLMEPIFRKVFAQINETKKKGSSIAFDEKSIQMMLILQWVQQ